MTEEIRDETGRFKPGCSGNPNGRPKSVKALAEEAQKHADRALLILAEILATGKPGDQIAAAKELLDRGFGKSPQSLEVSGPEGAPIQVSQLVDAPPKETREQWEARVKAKLGIE